MCAVLQVITDLSSILIPHIMFTWPLGALVNAQPVLNVFNGHFHSLKLGHRRVLPVGQGHALDQGGLGEGQDGQPLKLSLNIIKRVLVVPPIVRLVSISDYLATVGMLGTEMFFSIELKLPRILYKC